MAESVTVDDDGTSYEIEIHIIAIPQYLVGLLF